jgi:hypothetical protein
MTIYSKLFAVGTIGVVSTVIFTVPTDGATYVLRDVRLGPLSTGATAVVLGNASSELLAYVASSVQFEVQGFELRQVLTPGEGLLLSSLAGSWSYRLTGYRLS